MKTYRQSVAVMALLTAWAGGAGCSAPRPAAEAVGATPLLSRLDARPAAPPNVLPVKNEVPGPAEVLPAPGKVERRRDSSPLTLADFERFALERNPRLAQVTFSIEAARGNAVQAGLCPNPNLNVTGNELGDRTGPSGIWAVYASQEIVTADKLRLSRAAGMREVDQSTLAAVTERYRVFTDVRQNFVEVLVLQRRAEVLRALLGQAESAVETANKLLGAREAAQLDVVQLEADRERYRADLQATERALPLAFRRLAATAGVPELPLSTLSGWLNAAPPDYEFNCLRDYVLGLHPELRSAEMGVERARLAVRRAEVEPIPNVTVGAGYTRQGQNRSNDWDVGISLPVPVWNKNQGNIHAAQARLGEAVQEVGRVRNDLVNRLSTALSTFTAARSRADLYRDAVLPKSESVYQLSLQAYKGGQFEYLRLLQAQRAVGEARLEYLRSLGEMWRAAGELSGLTLQEQWPTPVDAPAKKDAS